MAWSSRVAAVMGAVMIGSTSRTRTASMAAGTAVVVDGEAATVSSRVGSMLCAEAGCAGSSGKGRDSECGESMEWLYPTRARGGGGKFISAPPCTAVGLQGVWGT